MKNPLSYQSTDFDCGPTTLINAISFLFRREDIPPDVVKHIMLYTLDAYNGKGEFGKNGTSKMAMAFLVSWLNQFGKVKKFPIHGEVLDSEEVFIGQTSKINVALQQGGVAVVRLRNAGWHYVLLTDVDKSDICFFDPYFRIKPYKEAGVRIIPDQPFKMNRCVRQDIMNHTGLELYNLGPADTREAIILFNLETQKTPAKTIEYFI